MCQDNYHVGLLGGSGPYPTVSPPSSLVSSVADSANLEVGFTRQLLWTRDPARLLDYTDDSLACDSRFHWIGSNRQFPLALVAIAGFGLNRFRYFSTPGETTSSGPLPLVISPALTADPVNVESSREELAQESSGQRIAEPSATGGNKKKRSAPSSSASVEARAGSEPDEPPTKRKKKEKKKKRTVGERSEHSEDVGGRELVAFDSSNRISVIRRLGDERGIDEKLWERGEEQTIEREEEEKIFVGDRTTSDGEGSKLAKGSDAMGDFFCDSWRDDLFWASAPCNLTGSDADLVNAESSREELAQESSGQGIAEPLVTGGNKKKMSAPGSSASVETRTGSEPDEPPKKRNNKEKRKKKKRTIGERSEPSEDVGGRELVDFDRSNRDVTARTSVELDQSPNVLLERNKKSSHEGSVPASVEKSPPAAPSATRRSGSSSKRGLVKFPDHVEFKYDGDTPLAYSPMECAELVRQIWGGAKDMLQVKDHIFKDPYVDAARTEVLSDGSMNFVVEMYDTALKETIFKLKQADKLVRAKDTALNRKTSEFKVTIDKASAEQSRLLEEKKAQKEKFAEKFGELKDKFLSVTVLDFRHLQLLSSTTRGLRWGRTLESLTLLALDSSMIERRSSLELCMRSVVCDFCLSSFLKSFDSSGTPFSLGRLL
ncbi:hypothetical protein F2Q70_00039353 [Brassica cretica]|uniref:Uncharacterized protein n=1 Tax=Brassica cretica TaxID=69181 RepID=A0A8S9KAR0_BRACR|nr:hypothetical protein F2Q70_00039353 [Brassica cretica]